MQLGSLAELLGAACCVREVRIGEVTSVIVDAELTRVLGLDIRSPDGRRRFLPWVAADLERQGGVGIRSAFLLVDAIDSYMRRGARRISDYAELATLRVDDDGHIANGMAVSIASRAGTSRR